MSNKLSNLSPATRRQHGVAAVEFSIILGLMVTLLTFPIFFSRYFMHYTIAQKAARDAAIYFSRLPLSEIGDHNRTLAALGVAGDMVAAETRSMRPGKGATPDIGVTCDDGPCGDGRPEEVSVHVRMRMYDEFFPKFTAQILGASGIRIRASVTMKYIGQ